MDNKSKQHKFIIRTYKIKLYNFCVLYVLVNITYIIEESSTESSPNYMSPVHTFRYANLTELIIWILSQPNLQFIYSNKSWIIFHLRYEVCVRWMGCTGQIRQIYSKRECSLPVIIRCLLKIFFLNLKI